MYTENARVKLTKGGELLKVCSLEMGCVRAPLRVAQAYSFSPNTLSHQFCSNCGSSILIEVTSEENPTEKVGTTGINVSYSRAAANQKMMRAE
jgi:hypothetical protein